jgi:hypothetical protein
VGDHQRTPAVVCFLFFFVFLYERAAYAILVHKLVMDGDLLKEGGGAAKTNVASLANDCESNIMR